MLRVATDCSGIEAPIMALKNMKVKFEHVWSSEIDKNCEKNIMANCKPKMFFRDMTKRNVASLPDIDLYVCGFPCQPFSSLRAINLQKETAVDKRKSMVKYCYEIIDVKKPLCFVLENVPKLMTEQNGKRFRDIIKRLEANKLYNVYHSILNTADFDIPQSRKRLYIVGLRKDSMVRPFAFPEPVKPKRVLEDFLIDKKKYPFRPDTMSERLWDRLPDDHNKKIYAIKWRAGEGTSVNAVPCITTSTDIYITRYNRNLTPREKLLLQGFPKTFNNVVSEAQLQKQAGNAMSVNVLEALFVSIFKAWGVPLPSRLKSK